MQSAWPPRVKVISKMKLLYSLVFKGTATVQCVWATLFLCAAESAGTMSWRGAGPLLWKSDFPFLPFQEKLLHIQCRRSGLEACPDCKWMETNFWSWCVASKKGRPFRNDFKRRDWSKREPLGMFWSWFKMDAANNFASWPLCKKLTEKSTILAGRPI